MTKFSFIIPTFNCEESIVKTLKSIYSQSYEDWKVFIRNDLSTDNTLKVVNSFIEKHRLSNKIKLINNDRKFGEVENTLDSLNYIEDDEVVCRVDGGDWITDNDTLYMLNEIYSSNKDLDAVWTAHRWGYTDRNISNHLPLDTDVYKHPWVSSHMKTFRRSSFKDIPSKNFKDAEGNYIMIACDQAIYLPLLYSIQKRKRKFGFFPKVCYHYSIVTDDPSIYHTERAYRQKYSAEWIRNRGFVNED